MPQKAKRANLIAIDGSYEYNFFLKHEYYVIHIWSCDTLDSYSISVTELMTEPSR